MKHIFIGDIHGKHEIVSRALDKDGLKVFVGDFMDSFDRSVSDQEKCLLLVLDAIEKKEAISIFGNHELNYLMPSRHRCSGYSGRGKFMIQRHQKRINELFVPFYQPTPEWFISHAGLHPEVSDRGYDFSDLSSPAHWIGWVRGGRNPVGGIFWCDFNSEFKPLEGLNQIFGHTAGKEIRTKHGENSLNYCIDCLDYTESFLELDL